MDNEHRPHQMYVRMRDGTGFIGHMRVYNNWEVIIWLRRHQEPFLMTWAFVRLQLGNQYHQYSFLLIPDEPRHEHAPATLTVPDYVEVTIAGHKYTADEFELYEADMHNHHSGTREHPERGDYPEANHVYVNTENGFVYAAPFLAKM